MVKIEDLENMTVKELETYKNLLNPKDHEFTLFVINELIHRKKLGKHYFNEFD